MFSSLSVCLNFPMDMHGIFSDGWSGLGGQKSPQGASADTAFFQKSPRKGNPLKCDVPKTPK